MPNELPVLSDIQKQLFSFNKSDTRKGLIIARQIHGLGMVGASGLLAILFPDYFASVDQFAVKSLYKIDSLQLSMSSNKIDPENIKLDEAVVLINIMKDKATSLNTLNSTIDWTPRKIDMVLWSMR